MVINVLVKSRTFNKNMFPNALAQASSQENSLAGKFREVLSSFFPIVIIIVIFYFLVIRPQQQKLKEHHDMMHNLKKGDKILTSGGLIATVIKSEEKSSVLTATIAENVEVEIMKTTVSSIISKKK
jgi:preprotein translocase subunit YajC